MVHFIKTRLSDGRILADKNVTDNWFSVYKENARFNFGKITWLTENSYEVVFHSKNYKVALIKQ